MAVIEQPEGQHCAVLGGIMAVRMKYLGVKGALVNGRVRDLSEIRECQLPVSLLSVAFVCVVSLALIRVG